MTEQKCELFYSSGGHGGPYENIDAAVKAAGELLLGNKRENRIEVRALDFKTVLRVVTRESIPDKTFLGYMARDQFGETIHLPGVASPRVGLLKHLGASSAEKMYVDTKEGKAKHVGYIVGDRWFTIYRVHEFVGIE